MSSISTKVEEVSAKANNNETSLNNAVGEINKNLIIMQQNHQLPKLKRCKYSFNGFCVFNNSCK